MENIYIDLRTQNKWIQEIFEGQDMASVEELLGKVEDLYDSLKYVKEEYEQFKQDVEDNYERVSVSKQLDIDDGYFMMD